MDRWIIEADIYRFKKALREDPGSATRRLIEQRLRESEARLVGVKA